MSDSSRQAAIDAAEEITFTLNSPITEEQFDMLEDVDFDHTNEITFHTKHGKVVKFIKAPVEIIEDYAELKKEFIRIASYIDTLLRCPDEQKANLMGMISRITKRVAERLEDDGK